MRYRSRTEIISQILKAAANKNHDSNSNTSGSNGNAGTKKIRIMYKANLHYEQLTEYLMFLTQNDLLCYDLDTQTFKITQKGLRFLDTYNRIDPTIRAQM